VEEWGGGGGGTLEKRRGKEGGQAVCSPKEERGKTGDEKKNLSARNPAGRGQPASGSQQRRLWAKRGKIAKEKRPFGEGGWGGRTVGHVDKRLNTEGKGGERRPSVARERRQRLTLSRKRGWGRNSGGGGTP